MSSITVRVYNAKRLQYICVFCNGSFENDYNVLHCAVVRSMIGSWLAGLMYSHLRMLPTLNDIHQCHQISQETQTFTMLSRNRCNEILWSSDTHRHSCTYIYTQQKLHKLHKGEFMFMRTLVFLSEQVKPNRNPAYIQHVIAESTHLRSSHVLHRAITSRASMTEVA